jgi:TRAP transporter TAXI family solute receptor
MMRWVDLSKRSVCVQAAKLCILVCFLVILLSSPVGSQQKTRMSIAGAQVGGTHYPMAIGSAEVINRFLPDYNAIALETGGTLENIRLLSKKEVEMAMADMQAAAVGWRGEKPFTAPIKNIRLGFYLNTVVLHVVTLEKTKITTIQDLKGKTVSVGAPGSMVASAAERLFRIHNLSIKDVKIRHIGPGESMEALGDGIIDAAVLYSALPSSAVASLAVNAKVKLVDADEKLLKAAETKENILSFIVPAGTYKGQTESATAWAVIGATHFNEATSADEVYKLTKVIMEHKDILAKVHPLGKGVRLVTKEEAAISLPPLHPGILKYAKEIGVTY